MRNYRSAAAIAATVGMYALVLSVAPAGAAPPGTSMTAARGYAGRPMRVDPALFGDVPPGSLTTPSGRPRSGLSAAQAVRGIGQSIQVQPPGQYRRHGNRGHGGYRNNLIVITAPVRE